MNKKNKFLLVAFIFVIVLPFIFVAVGCDLSENTINTKNGAQNSINSAKDGTEDEIFDIILNFKDINDKEVSDSIKVTDIDKINLPILKKDGFDFGGWFADKELKNAFDADKLQKGKTTLYPKWLRIIDVDLMYDCDKKNDKINEEKILTYRPFREDYFLVGWFTDKELTKKFDKKDLSKKDLVLYAKWIEGFNVTLNLDNGSANKKVTMALDVDYKIEEPAKDGFDFEGWTDSENNFFPTEGVWSNEDKDIQLNAIWATKGLYFNKVGDYFEVGNDNIKSDNVQVPYYHNGVKVDTIKKCGFAALLIKNIELPKSIKIIKTQAFTSCNKLQSIVIPNSVEVIEDFAFGNCISLENVTFSEKLKSIGFGAFNYTNLKNITIPDSVETVSRAAFENCNNLQSVEIGENVKELCAFNCASKLYKVSIKSKNLKLFGEGYGSGSTITVNYTIVVPKDKVTEYREKFHWFKDYIFENSKNVEKNGAIYNSNMTKFVSIANVFGELIIPDSVISLDNVISEQNDNIVSIVFPENFVFDGSLNLENFKKVKKIKYLSKTNKISLNNISNNCEVYVTEEMFSKYTDKETANFELCKIGENESVCNGDVLYNQAKTEIISVPCDLPADYKIPNEVITIGQYAFEYCKIKTISFNENIKTIKKGAFANCDNLISVELPTSITNIESNAFKSCSNLFLVKFNDKIENCAVDIFDACNDLHFVNYNCDVNDKSININFNLPNDKTILYVNDEIIKDLKSKYGDKVKSHKDIDYIYEDGIFYNKNKTRIYRANIECVYFEMIDSVESIDDSAFKGSSINYVKFSDKLKTIGEESFSNVNLISVKFPDSLTKIGKGCFSSNFIFELELPSKVKIYEKELFNSNLFSKVIVPEGVEIIKQSCFLGYFVRQIEFPSTLKKIEGRITYAYATRSVKFKSIEVPEISKMFFEEFIDDCKIFVPKDSLDKYKKAFGDLFVDDEEMKNRVVNCIKIDNEDDGYIMENGLYFSKNKTVLKSFNPGKASGHIDIPNTVIKIGDNAFNCIENVDCINIPNSVTEIGDEVFINVVTDTIIIPNSVLELGEKVFCNSLISNIQLSNQLTKIPKMAFMYSRFKNITIPDSVTEIEDSAFSSISYYVENLVIGSGVNKIGSNVFENSKICNLIFKSLVPPIIADIENIKLNKMTKIFVPADSVQSYKTAYSSLKDRIFADTETKYEIDGGLVYYGNKLVKCGTDDYYYVIREGCTEIADKVFEYQNYVMEIVLPETLTKIGEYAFYHCKNLGKIELPDSVVEIGNEAFCQCENCNIILTEGLQKIGERAFAECQALVDLVIPSTVVEIGRDAFVDCNNLKTVYIPESVTVLGDSLFNQNGIQITLDSATAFNFKCICYSGEENKIFVRPGLVDEFKNLNVNYTGNIYPIQS